MNKAKLKSYAPAARRDFIQAVTDRAHFFGISEKEIVPVEESGDVAIIGGRPFPRTVAVQRRKLDARVKRDGFGQVMESVAYTWFNRFLALRYMELHGYLEHGFRVLSSTGSSTTPEILDHAAQLDLPGLNKQKVTELKLDGNKDAELYRILLVAQCNALHSAMPFLFEKIEDETELLLPDNLLHSDSLIRKLVTEIEEEDWQEVEIIGWLYQFYISEKKDQVIGNVVKSEDIPAATQLFTPNWIVKYMVQNSLGKHWLATYPDSPLKAKMEYFIEPAEQTDEVKAQLAAITPDSLDPEKLTLLDPASGSGHILVEAYDVFKEIYLERGYSNRDFPRLILEKNLFGLDIDDRAAQMAGFALLMKARKDDRRILRSENPVKLNVMAIQEVGVFTIENSHWGENSKSIKELVNLFASGKTLGSLISVPISVGDKLPIISTLIDKNYLSGDIFVRDAAISLMPILRQAEVLYKKFDAVVMNPPYMGGKGMYSKIKEYLKECYPDSKTDIYAAFMERGLMLLKQNSLLSMVTMQSWMFLSSYEALRANLIGSNTLVNLAHFGARAFSEISGEVVQTAAFTFNNSKHPNWKPTFIRLIDGNEEDKKFNLIKGNNRFNNISQKELLVIDSNIIAYWVSKIALHHFAGEKLGNIAEARRGLQTGNSPLFIREWYEVSSDMTQFKSASKEELIKSPKKWFLFNNGGEFRKWAGSVDYVVNWKNNGEDIKNSGKAIIPSENRYFQPMLTWSRLSGGKTGFRYVRQGVIPGDTGPGIFITDPSRLYLLLSFLNSKVTQFYLNIIVPNLTFLSGDIEKIPCGQIVSIGDKVGVNGERCVDITQLDWDSYETSWNFDVLPLTSNKLKDKNISKSWQNWQSQCLARLSLIQELETENNLLFIEAFGLQEELSPVPPEEQLTLTRANLELDIKRLISYAIGCMMGRYSIDQAGLVYANSCNKGFDQSNYNSFPADDDGIVPVMDTGWFPDDAASRFEEFLVVAWSPETLEENLKFTADSLSPKGSETPRETIRRYISTQFFKDHLQTYKKRPIYWLFSSGKQRAFECLVYLHRYNESTLSRMRNEYVTPLQGKFSAQVDYLANEVDSASSTAERNRLQKQLDTLRKKQVELASFDDLLRHYADQRISLDLDDGVKVNYGKFGSLLAEVKAVTGGSE